MSPSFNSNAEPSTAMLVAAISASNDGARTWEAIEADADAGTVLNRVRISSSIESVQSLDLPSLLALQGLLCHGTVFGRWQNPRSWMPLAQQSLLNVDLRGRIISFLPEHYQRQLRADDEVTSRLAVTASGNHVELIAGAATPAQRHVADAVTTLVRYLIICRMGPSGIGKRSKGRSLDPSTITSMAYQQIPLLIALGLAKRLGCTGNEPNGRGFFCHITASDLDSVKRSDRKYVEREFKRICMFGDLGLWNDVCSFDETPRAVTAVKGAAGPLKAELMVDPHLPLPDEYVSEMGRKSLWLIQDLAPSLLRLTLQIQEMWLSSEDGSVTPSRIAQRRHSAISELLARHQWINGQGTPIAPPPFSFCNRSLGKGRAPLTAKATSDSPLTQWQPRLFIHVVHLLKLVQMAHFFVLGLSMGARKSEIATLERSCVKYAPDGLPYANGRTWKLIDRHEGAARDWVLPDLALQAVEQQFRLVTLIDTIGTIAPKRMFNGAEHTVPIGVHLWAQIGGGQSNRAVSLTNTRSALRAFARELGMSPDPGGQSLRVHRFRKTIARLGALAITQAPKILKDVFGHKNIEMTLYYILTDKDLQVDIERVSRELRVMRAKETVEMMVAAEENLSLPALGGFGGPAAPVIEGAIVVHRERMHRRGEQWGANTAVELAEILTLQGKAWQLVRRGVVCTKFPGTESGPCNKSKGEPEPARCQSHCSHRLEEPLLRADVEGAIRDALSAYQAAEESRDELLQALWADQVRIHIGRFPDLKKKWMDDTIAKEILNRTSEEPV